MSYILFIDRLPYSIRVLLESAVRNCDNFQVKKSDVDRLLNWEHNQTLEAGIEVAFKPARVILQVNVFIKNINFCINKNEIKFCKLNFNLRFIL